MLIDVLIIAGAYFWGSIPSSYLVARRSLGIDIRDYGSGNVGASNIMVHLGKPKGLMLGFFDSIVKGTIPVVLFRLFEDSLGIQIGVGLAVIAGHNWSPYIRFTGGRGVATAIGVILGFFMWKEVLILTLVLGLLGRIIFDEMGFWTLVALVILPILAFIFNEPIEVVYMSLGIGVLLMLKRLTANWERPSPDYHPAAVMVFRALWDRDVPGRMKWLARNPLSNQ